jgi:alpha-galactosidase
MSSLTGAIANCCSNPVVGLCHAYFETKDFIQKVFNLEDWSKISISIAGMNHFTWVTDFKIGKADGYKLLRERIGAGSIRDIIPKESADEIGIYSGHELCIDLFDTFGYIPYPADRHICEFLSFALCGSPERFACKKKDGIVYETIRYCNLKRTSIQWRRSQFATRDQRIHDWISGKEVMPETSRETGSNMIFAYLYNKPFNDAVNVLNIGQIPGLPLGSCVETMGMVDGLGVRPLMAEGIPEYLLEVMRPQAMCQKWITEGVIEGNTDKLFQALYRDPQCMHLKPRVIKEMGLELLEANSRFVQKD